MITTMASTPIANSVMPIRTGIDARGAERPLGRGLPPRARGAGSVVVGVVVSPTDVAAAESGGEPAAGRGEPVAAGAGTGSNPGSRTGSAVESGIGRAAVGG